MKLKSSTITNKKKTKARSKSLVSLYSNAGAPSKPTSLYSSERKATSSLGVRDRRLPPIPPGKILKEELMEPYGLSANKLAQMLGVATNRIARIIKGEREITVDTAMRLARCFNTSPQFWLNLQMRYELEMAEDQALPEHINGVVKIFAGKLKANKSRYET